MGEIKTYDDLSFDLFGETVEQITKQFIVIQMGQEQYGIDIQYVYNIVRMQKITRVPKVVNYMKGVINLRGEVIPILSLRLKMGLEEDVVTPETRIIILKLDQHESIGILVDKVNEVVTLGEDHIEKVSYDKDEKCKFLNGIGKAANHLISLLDIHAVLAEPEEN